MPPVCVIEESWGCAEHVLLFLRNLLPAEAGDARHWKIVSALSRHLLAGNFESVLCMFVSTPKQACWFAIIVHASVVCMLFWVIMGRLLQVYCIHDLTWTLCVLCASLWHDLSRRADVGYTVGQTR